MVVLVYVNTLLGQYVPDSFLPVRALTWTNVVSTRVMSSTAKVSMKKILLLIANPPPTGDCPFQSELISKECVHSPCRHFIHIKRCVCVAWPTQSVNLTTRHTDTESEGTELESRKTYDVKDGVHFYLSFSPVCVDKHHVTPYVTVSQLC
jgi:hypothetical protein